MEICFFFICDVFALSLPLTLPLSVCLALLHASLIIWFLCIAMWEMVKAAATTSIMLALQKKHIYLHNGQFIKYILHKEKKQLLISTHRNKFNLCWADRLPDNGQKIKIIHTNTMITLNTLSEKKVINRIKTKHKPKRNWTFHIIWNVLHAECRNIIIQNIALWHRLICAENETKPKQEKWM